MDHSLYLGQLMSPVFLLVGLALLLRQNHYTNAYKSWVKNEGLMLFSAMVVLAAGVAVVIYHNIWVLDWPVLLTIGGWGMVIKGVFLLFLPKKFDKLVDWMMNLKWLLSIGALIWVVAGLYIGYYTWIV